MILPKHLAALSAGLKIVNLEPGDPAISEACEAYKEKWGLPASAQPVATQWYGLARGGEKILIVGERTREDVLEITDAYPVPGVSKRLVTAAIFGMLNIYKSLHDAGIFKKIGCSCLFGNDGFRQALERVWGVPPVAVVYYAGVV